MNKRKYPRDLFFFGFFSNIVFYYLWLFIPAVILLIVGIFVRICLYIGLAILLFDIILSLIDQLNIRKEFLTESDNPDFREFQDALSKDGNWKDNIDELINKKLSSSQSEIQTDEEIEEGE